MGRKNKSSSASTSVVVRTEAVKPAMTTATTQPSKRKNRRRRLRQSPLAPTAERGYIATLNDPFEYPPVRLGFGSMCPTGVGTVYQRSTFTTNADGSFTLALAPHLNSGLTASQGPILLNTGSFNVTTGWSNANFANASAYASIMSEARVVSFGIKVMPTIPLTAQPGVLYVGSVNGLTYGAITGTTTNAFANAPAMKVGLAAPGESAWATGRPEDPEAFVFRYDIAHYPDIARDLTFSVPVICGTDFSAGASMHFEAVINFEYLHNTSIGIIDGMMNSSASNAASSSLADKYPSVESMFGKIGSLLNDPGNIGAFTRFAAKAALRGAANYFRNSVPQSHNRLMEFHPSKDEVSDDYVSTSSLDHSDRGEQTTTVPGDKDRDKERPAPRAPPQPSRSPDPLTRR